MLVVYRLVLDVIEDQLCRGIVLRVTTFDDNKSQWHLTCETFTHDSNNGNVFYRLVPYDEVFKFSRGYLITLKLDQIFGAVSNERVPLFIFVSNIA